jgi:hypothetical protein
MGFKVRIDQDCFLADRFRDSILPGGMNGKPAVRLSLQSSKEEMLKACNDLVAGFQPKFRPNWKNGCA